MSRCNAKSGMRELCRAKGRASALSVFVERKLQPAVGTPERDASQNAGPCAAFPAACLRKEDNCGRLRSSSLAAYRSALRTADFEMRRQLPFAVEWKSYKAVLHVICYQCRWLGSVRLQAAMPALGSLFC